MRKLFRIYAAQGGHSAELELPATDHELLDLMERLRLGPGQSPYLAIQEYLEPDYSYDYLSGYIQNPPDLLQLNALARRLEGLDTHGAAFEGFVTMDIQKGETPIPLPPPDRLCLQRRLLPCGRGRCDRRRAGPLPRGERICPGSRGTLQRGV